MHSIKDFNLLTQKERQNNDNDDQSKRGQAAVNIEPRRAKPHDISVQDGIYIVGAHCDSPVND